VLNVSLADLRPEVDTKPSPLHTSGKPIYQESLDDMLEATQRTQIQRALEQANGVVAGPNETAVQTRLESESVSSKCDVHHV